MAKYEVDLSLIRTGSLVSMEAKAEILEALLNEANIKFEKYYSASNNREMHSSHGKYIDKKYKITIYEFDCGDSYYAFLLFLLNKRLKQIDTLNNSLL